MAKQDYHGQDFFYLRGFGANLERDDLFEEYKKLRETWGRIGNRGELPQATLLDLAVRYRGEKPKPAPTVTKKALVKKKAPKKKTSKA